MDQSWVRESEHANRKGLLFARMERESCWVGVCGASAAAAAVGVTQV